MLIGEGLIAHTSFVTVPGGAAGACTVNRAYKCLVSGSGVTGAPAAVADGRYTLTLDDGVNINDCDISMTIEGTAGGTAANGTVAQVFHTSDTVKEINFYTVAAAGGVLTDVTPGTQAITCNVTIRRVSPA